MLLTKPKKSKKETLVFFNFLSLILNPYFKNLTIFFPHIDIYERKWEVVEEVGDESNWFKFTLASYNVLSQNLLDNNKRLYKICQPRFLTWTYRKAALKKELSYYQPDVRI